MEDLLQERKQVRQDIVSLVQKLRDINFSLYTVIQRRYEKEINEDSEV